jgi:hypothetical protein
MGWAGHIVWTIDHECVIHEYESLVVVKDRQ